MSTTPKGTGRGRLMSQSPASSGASTPNITQTLASRFSRLSIPGGATAAGADLVEPMKRPNVGRAGRVQTLIPNLILYKYDVEVGIPPRDAGRGRGRGRVSTAAKADAFDKEIARQESCDVFRRCVLANPTVFTNPDVLIYDRRRTLFTIDKPKYQGDKFEWIEESEARCTVKIAASTEQPTVRFQNVYDAVDAAVISEGGVCYEDRAFAQFMDMFMAMHVTSLRRP